MVTQFDDKGKIFTKQVTKQPVETIIQLPEFRVSGFIHIRPEDRLKDELDKEEIFLAVTDARIFDKSGQLLYTTSFIAINRRQILWIAPQDCLQV